MLSKCIEIKGVLLRGAHLQLKHAGGWRFFDWGVLTSFLEQAVELHWFP